MSSNINNFIKRLEHFKEKYASQRNSLLENLAYSQRPEIMMITCCDSRIQPALMLQCDPGDLFIVRNVANIVPAYQNSANDCSTSAALEFGVNFLQVRDLIIMGHSQCGGINALLDNNPDQYEFIDKWVNNLDIHHIRTHMNDPKDIDHAAKLALQQSYQNCLSFPWVNQAVTNQQLTIHLWFFEIKSGKIYSYAKQHDEFTALEV